MFPSRYFNLRYWAKRYWAKVGGVADSEDCFLGLQGNIDPVSAFQGEATDRIGLQGLITTSIGLNGIINTDPIGSESILFPVRLFQGAIDPNGEAFNTELCDC